MNSRERTCLDCGEVNVGGHEILALDTFRAYGVGQHLSRFR